MTNVRLIGPIALLLTATLPADAIAQQREVRPGPGAIHSERADPAFESAWSEAEGTYHNEGTLRCSDCHVMHASMQHNYAGGPGAEGTEPSYPAEFVATPDLLRRVDPVDTCLACHDGMPGVPDVLGIDINALQNRSGGWFDEVESVNPRGHDLGRDLPTGGFGLCMRCHFGGSDQQVTCIDCHDPHGNGKARNLQWASDPAGTPPLGLFVSESANGLQRYEAENVAYGTLDSTQLREVTNICTDCHHVFTGATYNDQNNDGIHERHPSYDSERNDPNNIAQGESKGTTFPEHWMLGEGTGFVGTERVRFVTAGATNFASAGLIDGATNGVFCLSCHKAHGSQSSFGLIWNVQGDIDRVGCDQCHMTSPFANL